MHDDKHQIKDHHHSGRQELIDGGYLDFTPGIKGRPSTYHLRSVEEMEGWQPPPG